jgi:hypothetical protein
MDRYELLRLLASVFDRLTTRYFVTGSLAIFVLWRVSLNE